jgi:hypothetical protein
MGNRRLVCPRQAAAVQLRVAHNALWLLYHDETEACDVVLRGRFDDPSAQVEECAYPLAAPVLALAQVRIGIGGERRRGGTLREDFLSNNFGCFAVQNAAQRSQELLFCNGSYSSHILLRAAERMLDQK